MDITKKGNTISLTGEKKEIIFDDGIVIIDSMEINFPGEYEKSGVMARVIERNSQLLYEMKFLDKKVAYINCENLEITEELADFFGNIDILIIKGSKESIKTFENLEAKIVVPYGEHKDIFLSTLGQHPESTNTFRIKSDIGENEVFFVNLD